MPVKHTGGVAPSGKQGESPFDIYRDTLDLVMSTLSLDEDAAINIILNELDGLPIDWHMSDINTACLQSTSIDWKRAWLN